MSGQRVVRGGKFGKHELPSLDKRRADVRAHDVDAEREEAVAVGRDEPPPAFPPFRAKESGRAEFRAVQQPTIAVQGQGRRQPLPQLPLLVPARSLQVCARFYFPIPAGPRVLPKAVDDPPVGFSTWVGPTGGAEIAEDPGASQ